MFSSTNLFSKITCPYSSKCELRYCIFNHDAPSEEAAPPGGKRASSEQQHGQSTVEPAAKKRKVDVQETHEPKITSRQKAITRPTAAKPCADTPLTSHSRPISPPPKRLGSLQATQQRAIPKPMPKSSTTLEASPRSAVTQPTKKPLKAEALVPRTSVRSPTQFATRVQLLKLIHDQFVRLDKEIRASDDPDKDALAMSSQELIVEALNEEERTAKESPSIYSNILKLRIVALRRMKVAEWKEERLKHIARDNPGLLKKKKKKVETGLSTSEEIAMLPVLLTPIDELAEYGYVPKPPTDAEIKEAQEGLEAARNWERCDRCDSKFQVFPGRRDDGVLATKGPCIYHWGRKRLAAKQPGGGPRPSMWMCCHSEMGSKGCTRNDNHVFKVTDPKRLATVMQFEETKNNGPDPPEHAVAFDCEMGYTSLGLELIRLTATAWPSGEDLVDVLVRPFGEILDLNTRFSGVTQEHFANAIPYNSDADGNGNSEGKSETAAASKKRKQPETAAPDSTTASSSIVKKRRTSPSTSTSTSIPTPNSQPTGGATHPQLRIVDSPMHARTLLQSHLTTTTPLIGHAIDNDLNAVRLCHPAIVDTVLLFPHPSKLPFRYGLKALAKTHLEWDIQTADELGHDSREDAMATGELVRFAVGRRWEGMKEEGWRVEDGVFVAPD